MRGLIVRKTRKSLTQTALVTFDTKVQPKLDGVEWRATEQEYRYPNGSVIVVSGLDDPTKVMSAEFDLIYVQEAVEISEDDHEKLTSRLRNGVMPYQQLVEDCNPDAPHHWIKVRADRGKLLMLESRHEDNPTLWDHERGDWTATGRSYVLGTLESLSGVRYLRLRKGQWAAAEGIVYDQWDRAVHLVDRVPVPEDFKGALCPSGIPMDWTRYWSIDFGYTNPFVWQAWAEDPDGRLYRYREMYQTQRLVEDHARVILEASAGEPRPKAIICDHDAEGRATLSNKMGMRTVPAMKAVQTGIQAVQSRLRKAGDGLPRLFLVRGALMQVDATLADRKLPTCTEEEIDGYVWDTSNNRKQGEEPLKANDHGCDCLRYMVAHVDRRARLQFVG